MCVRGGWGLWGGGGAHYWLTKKYQLNSGGHVPSALPSSVPTDLVAIPQNDLSVMIIVNIYGCDDDSTLK